MGVLDQRRFVADADALLDDLASGDAEIVLMQVVRRSPGACCNVLPLAPLLRSSPMLIAASPGVVSEMTVTR